MNWKQDGKTALIALGVVAVYHWGFLNFIPGFDAPKKNGPIGK